MVTVEFRCATFRRKKKRLKSYKPRLKETLVRELKWLSKLTCLLLRKLLVTALTRPHLLQPKLRIGAQFKTAKMTPMSSRPSHLRTKATLNRTRIPTNTSM